MAKGILFEKYGIRVWAMSAEEISWRKRLGFKEVEALPENPEDKPDLGAMKIQKLRKLAEAEGLEGYKTLPKDDLVKALAEKLEGDE